MSQELFLGCPVTLIPYIFISAERGHNVTVVTPFKSKTLPPGVREILVQSNIQQVFDQITEEEFVKGKSFMMPIKVQVKINDFILPVFQIEALNLLMLYCE